MNLEFEKPEYLVYAENVKDFLVKIPVKKEYTKCTLGSFNKFIVHDECYIRVFDLEN